MIYLIGTSESFLLVCLLYNNMVMIYKSEYFLLVCSLYNQYAVDLQKHSVGGVSSNMGSLVLGLKPSGDEYGCNFIFSCTIICRF